MNERKKGIRLYKNILRVPNQSKLEKSSQPNLHRAFSHESALENALVKSTQEELLARPRKCTPVYKEVKFNFFEDNNNSKVVVCEETGRPVPTD
jgi:hypothetical protein